MTWHDFYRLHCTKRFGPAPTAEELDEIARNLQVILPAHYRRFIREHNGGRFDDPVFVVSGRQYRLSELYGVRADTNDVELFSPSSLSLFDDNDPVQVVPIGYSCGGDLLLLVVATDGDDFGRVLLKKPFSGESIDLGADMDEFLALFIDTTGT